MRNKSGSMLSIAVPTYNRADFLDMFLEAHAFLAKKYGVDVYVSDNASTDNTVDIINKWKKKSGNIVSYSFDETVSGDENREKVLSMSSSEYTWLMGDTYEIPERSLSSMVDFLSDNAGERYDFIVVNYCNNLKNIDSRVYVDANMVLVDLAWMIAGVCCNIFHKSAIENGIYNYELQEDFAHVGFVLDYMMKYQSKLYWCQDVSVVSLKTPVRKQGWGGRFFLIMFENWPKFIYGLPDYFLLSNKDKALLTLPRKTGILSVRSMLNLRGQNNLDIHVYNKYRKNLFIAPGLFSFYLLGICFMPPLLCRWSVGVVEWYRRKRYKLIMKFFPDAII